MPWLNNLDTREFKVAERLSAWTLTLIGYFVALGILIDDSGWRDPVFNVVRQVPGSPITWGVALLACTLLFNVGYTRHHENHWRGRLIIWGAFACACWWVALSLCFTRVVYEMPSRITILWPIITFLVGMMYMTRVVVYSNSFSGDRWNTNPYQLWDTTFLMLASLSQVIIGIAPVSILTEIERPAALTVGSANLFGALVILFGLHLRDQEQGLSYELAGAFSMVLTLGWYCAAVLHRAPLSGTTLGFSMPEAFVFATLHRGIQILTLRWARWSDRGGLEHRMINALNPTGQRQIEPEVVEPETVGDNGVET